IELDFFFQAEDGIRDRNVTGVQTCALPIWNIVTSGINDTAKNFSGVNNVDHDLRYDQANEFVEISKKLWNSWRDVDSQSIHKAGKFLKNQQPEPINCEGDFYNVKGPLNIDQSPQGYPLLVQAGSSKKGTDFASKHAESIWTAQNDIDVAHNYAQKLRGHVEEKNGPEQEVVIMPGIFPFNGETSEEAQANSKEFQDLIGPDMGLEL